MNVHWKKTLRKKIATPVRDRKRYKKGGMLKKPTNPGLKKLPTEVRNKMGFMKKGGSVKGKCKVDGIAVRGRTRAKHK